MREEIEHELSVIFFGKQPDELTKAERLTLKNAVESVEDRIKYSNKALLRRVRERGPKDKPLRDGEGSMTSNTILIIQNENNALWHQALNEEEATL